MTHFEASEKYSLKRCNNSLVDSCCLTLHETFGKVDRAEEVLKVASANRSESLPVISDYVSVGFILCDVSHDIRK